MYQNKEGYADPTAGSAIESVYQEERKKEEAIRLIKMLKQIASLTGYELTGEFQLKDRHTEKTFVYTGKTV